MLDKRIERLRAMLERLGGRADGIFNVVFADGHKEQMELCDLCREVVIRPDSIADAFPRSQSEDNLFEAIVQALVRKR